MPSLAQLNELRAGLGISPLKAWKESKVKLADATTKAEGALLSLNPTLAAAIKQKYAVTALTEKLTPEEVAIAAQERKEQIKVGQFADGSKSDQGTCHKCGKMFHLDDLDGKDDGTGDFNILECKKCYGAGFTSARPPKVTVCPPSPELRARAKREAEIDKVVSKRLNGDTHAKPEKPKAARPLPTPPRKVVPEGSISLADIARELGMDPKVARAKMRRVTLPSDILTGKHTYKLTGKQKVVGILSADLRKK
jgi:hypothetical protein